jgi:hypothetical protein
MIPMPKPHGVADLPSPAEQPIENKYTFWNRHIARGWLGRIDLSEACKKTRHTLGIATRTVSNAADP